MTPQEEAQIQTLSEGLSQSEVLDYLGKTKADYSPEDWSTFERAWKRGRTALKVHAVQKLKESMTGRHGMQASLATLVRFAEEWPDGSTIEDRISEGKSFRIVLDD